MIEGVLLARGGIVVWDGWRSGGDERPKCGGRRYQA
jgi:hypothetical protein